MNSIHALNCEGFRVCFDNNSLELNHYSKFIKLCTVVFMSIEILTYVHIVGHMYLCMINVGNPCL